MKLGILARYAVMQLIIAFVAVTISEGNESDFPDDIEYFVLNYQNGTEIEAHIKYLHEILQELEPDFQKLPRYDEIMEGGSKKLDNTLKQMQSEGADRTEMSTVAGNILADTYEELFAEAGFKLKIYNRQPVYLV